MPIALTKRCTLENIIPNIQSSVATISLVLERNSKGRASLEVLQRMSGGVGHRTTRRSLCSGRFHPYCYSRIRLLSKLIPVQCAKGDGLPIQFEISNLI